VNVRSCGLCHREAHRRGNFKARAIEPCHFPKAGIQYREHHGFANLNFSIHSGEVFFDLCRGRFLNSYEYVVLGWRSEITKPATRKIARLVRRRLLKVITEVNSLSELQRPRHQSS
jgi:hypothetical protein